MNEPIPEFLAAEASLPTGYYRVKKPLEEIHDFDKVPVGELIHVRVGPNKWHFRYMDKHYSAPRIEKEKGYWYVSDDAFHAMLEHVPDGVAERERQIATIETNLLELDEQAALAGQQILALDPYGPDEAAQASGGPTDLAVSKASMTQLKRRLATGRDNVLRVRKKFQENTDRLKGYLAERHAILKAELERRTSGLMGRVEELTKSLEKAQEALWTVNLYLGKDEEIRTLRKGKPADPKEKVTLRQRVLRMDEECGEDAEEGGIDVNSAEKFDKWIKADPKHLQQVLPEPKGLVAFHVRREDKDYGEAKSISELWGQQEQNAANKTWTYFLIRNGERLYRVFVDLKVPNKLFPNRDDAVQVPEHEVGSKAYYKELADAEESNNETKVYLMRIALVLQGLVDRTGVFKPLPTEQFNLFDPRMCEEFVRFIYDDEKLLTDGRPTFQEWQKEVNARLEVGHRIVGHWGYDLRGERDGGRRYDCRISPENADLPKDEDVHTIARLDDGRKYVFLYQREGERYRRHEGYVPYRTRASCWVVKDGKSFIDIDAVTAEDLRYYQTHRESRKKYADMLPVIAAALAVKEREAAEETPFFALLAGQIMKEHGVDRETAEAAVPELVAWWKVKNRQHRALTDDDALAVKQIVTEYRLRTKQKGVREKQADRHASVVRTVCQTYDDVLSVWHVRDNEYVAYRPANASNVFVHVVRILTKKGNVEVLLPQEWKTVDNRYLRWEKLYESDRWKEWRVHPVRTKVLSDPQIEEVIDRFCKAMADKGWRPLAAEVNADFEIRISALIGNAVVPTKRLLTSEENEPLTRVYDANWTLNGATGELKVTKDYGENYTFNPAHPVWEGARQRYGEKPHTVVRKWDAHIAEWTRQYKAHKAFEKAKEALRHKYAYAVKAIAKLAKDQQIVRARLAYDEEHGASDLWPDYLAGLKLEAVHPNRLDGVLDHCADIGVDPVGKTVGELHAAYGKQTTKEERKRRGRYYRGTPDWNYVELDEFVLPGFVIPPAPPPEPEEVTDETDDGDDSGDG